MTTTDARFLPTARELQVMQLTAAALTDREAALELHLALVTVKTHWQNLRRKYGATRLRVVVLAMQRGDLAVEEEA